MTPFLLIWSRDTLIVTRHYLNGLKGHYQKFHKVLITDSAVEAAVRLSSRYINGRYLPDKAIDMLDTACARVCMGLAATPAEIDTANERLAYIERRQQHLAEEAIQQGINGFTGTIAGTAELSAYGSTRGEW
jgi:type VI secretion system protein VasG